MKNVEASRSLPLWLWVSLGLLAYASVTVAAAWTVYYFVELRPAYVYCVGPDKYQYGKQAYALESLLERLHMDFPRKDKSADLNRFVIDFGEKEPSLYEFCRLTTYDGHYNHLRFAFNGTHYMQPIRVNAFHQEAGKSVPNDVTIDLKGQARPEDWRAWVGVEIPPLARNVRAYVLGDTEFADYKEFFRTLKGRYSEYKGISIELSVAGEDWSLAEYCRILETARGEDIAFVGVWQDVCGRAHEHTYRPDIIGPMGPYAKETCAEVLQVGSVSTMTRINGAAEGGTLTLHLLFFAAGKERQVDLTVQTSPGDAPELIAEKVHDKWHDFIGEERIFEVLKEIGDLGEAEPSALLKYKILASHIMEQPGGRLFTESLRAGHVGFSCTDPGIRTTPPVENLAAVKLPDRGKVLLDWVIPEGAEYDRIVVCADGERLAILPPDANGYEHNPARTPELKPEKVTYRVVSEKDMVPSPFVKTRLRETTPRAETATEDRR